MQAFQYVNHDTSRGRVGYGARMARESSWTFLTNHAHVLLAIAEDPDLRLRDIADRVGVTERTAAQIVSDLDADGYVRKERVGRRNHYVLDPSRPLRHPLESDNQIGELLDAIVMASPPDADAASG